jgi:hypothetical protein
MTEFVEVTKSEDEGPVPTVWREPLSQAVESFSYGDFRLKSGIAGVDPVTEEDANSILSNIEAYGAELSSLPEESWDTSVCRWTGVGWELLVDLFTVKEGLSDLVMFARVTENNGAYRIKIDTVHVP